jgi:hypothetical protein
MLSENHANSSTPYQCKPDLFHYEGARPCRLLHRWIDLFLWRFKEKRASGRTRGSGPHRRRICSRTAWRSAPLPYWRSSHDSVVVWWVSAIPPTTNVGMDARLWPFFLFVPVIWMEKKALICVSPWWFGEAANHLAIWVLRPKTDVGSAAASCLLFF